MGRLIVSKAERKEREKEWRRNEIIDTAEKVFFSRGYENVKMDDIAKEMGLARGTLYLYFKNKEDIYVSIAIRASKIVNQVFTECSQRKTTGIEKVRSLIMSYNEFYKKYPGYYSAYYHSGMFDQKDSPELEELRRIRADSFRMVVDAVLEGIRDGTIRKDVQPEAATLVMLFSTNDVLNLTPVTMMYMKKFGLDQDGLFDITLDMMMRSIENVKKARKAA
ncbi:TetR/AcrR family transcriptional regulator [Methanocella sp. CWC-04]|uniref:TetR/AcrR family transcriptional regulator n=1 Tax=Methanooceanicella nereidis TaxID=2052831 RepID=A0AAP2RDJ4_9EURY|nr:TetR/AcrR family transcriptional regulator [Methanocella sp. CWC-04]MCD1295533.1 TetR/AcrR family transcriptional regulator [Methanocella sp. CWC-04]